MKTGIPCAHILTGKTCFNHRENLLSLQELCSNFRESSCSQNKDGKPRFFPVQDCSAIQAEDSIELAEINTAATVGIFDMKYIFSILKGEHFLISRFVCSTTIVNKSAPPSCSIAHWDFSLGIETVWVSLLVKFGFYEKATKIWNNLPLDLKFT